MSETPEYFKHIAPNGNPTRDQADLIIRHEREQRLPPAQQQPNETRDSFDYRTGR